MTGFYTQTPGGHKIHINGDPDMPEATLKKLNAIFDKAIESELVNGGHSAKVRAALERFSELLGSLDCECDSYNGFTCSLHNDRILVQEALETLE